MPYWVPLLAAVITGIFAWIIFVLTGRREHAKSKKEGIAKFRSAFAEQVTQFDKYDTHWLFHKEGIELQHDIAILELRHHIDPMLLTKYDEAAKNFKQCRSELTPASLAVLNSLNTGVPPNDDDSKKMKAALGRLMAFAMD